MIYLIPNSHFHLCLSIDPNTHEKIQSMMMPPSNRGLSFFSSFILINCCLASPEQGIWDFEDSVENYYVGAVKNTYKDTKVNIRLLIGCKISFVPFSDKEMKVYKNNAAPFIQFLIVKAK